jgi:thioesterase domain-containing protein
MSSASREIRAGALLENPGGYKSLKQLGRVPFFFSGDRPLVSGVIAHQPVVFLPQWPVVSGRHSIDTVAGEYVNLIYEIQDRGPFLLGGICSGGLLAYEIASRFVEAGHEVGLLALVETFHPEYFTRLKSVRRVLRWARYPGEFVAGCRAALTKRFTAEKGTAEDHGGPTEEAIADRRSWHVPQCMAMPHEFREYAGRLTLIVGERSLTRFFPMAGWDKIAEGGIDYHCLAGGDLHVLRGRNSHLQKEKDAQLAELGALLVRLIEKSVDGRQRGLERPSATACGLEH